jgi:hypothetical protein
MVEGLRDALSQGVKTAVKTLGQEDGFLANDLVKIPIPESLESVESTLRKLGQDEVADKFIAALNHAAEKAMPSAVSIFGEAISSMSINDAKDILEGPDDAATQYFRGRSDDDLRASFAPLVKEATDKVGVTATYKDLIKKLGPMASLLDTEKLDIDSYVTEKALDGLFLMIAEEEKKIREDPVARTTDLLKKVFAKL